MIAMIRGGGDLASGVAYRLHRSGLQVYITELAQPMSVRRLVSFAEAVYEKTYLIEGIEARLATNPADVFKLMDERIIPVLIDPDGYSGREINPDVVIDGRMMKKCENRLDTFSAGFIVGLGPGFRAGKNCDAVVETKRGHFLGRVYWEGSAEKDTGLPEPVPPYGTERVLRSPCAGKFHSDHAIGDMLNEGDLIGYVDNQGVLAPFTGMVRGLLRNGLPVAKNTKIGDIDPRNDIRLISHISDKALAVSGGVLEAILTRHHSF